MSYGKNFEFPTLGGLSKSLTAILILNVAIFFLVKIPIVEFFSYQFLWLHTNSPMLWQSLTYMFFHGSFEHLFFNMLSLYFIGPAVCRGFYGDVNFVRYYLICGVGGAVLSYVVGFFMPSSAPIIGTFLCLLPIQSRGRNIYLGSIPPQTQIFFADLRWV